MEKYVTQRLKDIVIKNYQAQVKKSLNLDLNDLKHYKGPFTWKCTAEGTELILLNCPLAFVYYEVFAKAEENEIYYFYNGEKLRKISRDFALRLILKRYEEQEYNFRMTA